MKPAAVLPAAFVAAILIYYITGEQLVAIVPAGMALFTTSYQMRKNR